MAAPTFIQEAETANWNTSTSPKTTASFDTVAGDVLVAVLIIENSASGNNVYTVAGGTLNWGSPVQEVDVADYSTVIMWTATVDVDKNMAVTFTRSAGDSAAHFGGNILTFRTSDGLGASSKTNVASGAPTLNLTTTQANSAIVVANGDWAPVDGASRTWRVNAGALTEQSYGFTSGRMTWYVGVHADAGAVATYAVGLSAPSGQKYAIVAVEIKGSTAGVPAPWRTAAPIQALQRASRH